MPVHEFSGSRVTALQLVTEPAVWCVGAYVCTQYTCLCGANAHELYIHIQMLPPSSEALITNSQCLR